MRTWPVLFCWYREGQSPHWPIFSWLQKVDFFENHTIVAMQSNNANFYACEIIKVTSGIDLKETIFLPVGATIKKSKDSWNIFQTKITPLLGLTGAPQGCLEKQNCPLSLNLAVWCAKIGPKTQKLQKTIIFCCFSCHFWGFLEILASRPNFCAPNYQIQTQWTILLL